VIWSSPYGCGRRDLAITKLVDLALATCWTCETTSRVARMPGSKEPKKQAGIVQQPSKKEQEDQKLLLESTVTRLVF